MNADENDPIDGELAREGQRPGLGIEPVSPQQQQQHESRSRRRTVALLVEYRQSEPERRSGDGLADHGGRGAGERRLREQRHRQSGGRPSVRGHAAGRLATRERRRRRAPAALLQP